MTVWMWHVCDNSIPYRLLAARNCAHLLQCFQSEHCSSYSFASKVYPTSVIFVGWHGVPLPPNLHPIFQQGVVDTCLSSAWLAALQAFPNLDGASNCQHVHQRHYDNFFCLANASWQLLQSWWFYFFSGHQIQFVGSCRASYSATEPIREQIFLQWHSSCAVLQRDGACAFRGLQLAFYRGEIKIPRGRGRNSSYHILSIFNLASFFPHPCTIHARYHQWGAWLNPWRLPRGEQTGLPVCP